MLRSLCFYSQSSGYKSGPKEIWHTHSPQFARDRTGIWKFSKLRCHLDLALHLVCSVSMHARFFLKGVPSVQLMLLCSINPL